MWKILVSLESQLGCNDGLLGQKSERIFCRSRHGWKAILLWQTQERTGDVQKEHKYDRKDSGRVSFGYLDLPFWSSPMTRMHWVILHCIAELRLWWLYRKTLAKELSVRFLRLPFSSADSGNWRATQFLLDWIVLVDSCVVSMEWIGRQLLICVWCLLVDWIKDKEDWNHLKGLFLNGSPSP